MSAKTYAQVKTSIATILQDANMVTFTEAMIDDEMPRALSEISMLIPRYPSYLTSAGVLLPATLLTTVANSRFIQLSDGDMWDLIAPPDSIGLHYDPYIEYPIDEDPMSQHNIKRNGNVIELVLDTAPTSAASCRLWIGKRHILQKALGDSTGTGAIKTGAAAGVVSLALKSLGAGTINEGTKLTIAGDSCVYNVYATATIAANEATVYIYPALKAAVLADAVVTIVIQPSTLDLVLEAAFEKYCAGNLAEYKARSKLSIGMDLDKWGEKRLARAQSLLAGLIKYPGRTEYPRT